MPSFADSIAGFNPQNNPSRVRTEPIEGNSLTRFLRSSFNDLSRTGENAFDTGHDVFSTGVKGFAPSINYWESILSGDKSKMSQAVAPTAGMISKNYDQAADQVKRTMPRGGYSSVLQAEMPYRKAGEVNNLLLGLQPQAAQQLQGIAAQLASIGLNEQQIGTVIRSLVIQGQLGVRGQDVGEHNAAMGLAGSLANTATGGFTSMFNTNVMANARP